MDEIIDQLIATDDANTAEAEPHKEPAGHVLTHEQKDSSTDLIKKHRERLAALAAGGQAKQYLGKVLTVDQIESLDEDEVEKLYTRYEARLGAAMTKTLGQAALQLYSGVVSMFLPISPENQKALVCDLEADPFVEHALSSATCELYHRYGMLLAPLTTALTTIKYTQFESKGHQTFDNGGRRHSCGESNQPREPATDTRGGESDQGHCQS